MKNVGISYKSMAYVVDAIWGINFGGQSCSILLLECNLESLLLLISKM